MKTVQLNYSNVDNFVESNSHRGYFWNGWDIKRWVPNPSGYMSKNGSFRNGKWGMDFSFPLESDGTWNVKVPKNVEHN